MSSLPDYTTPPMPARANLIGSTESWEEWPRNSRNSNPAVDDADEVFSNFCKDLACRTCNPDEAMHVSLYSGSGQTLFDDKVSAADLPVHLEDIGELGSRSSTKDNAPQYRLYFAADCGTEDVMCTRYMRQFLCHYNAPADVALALTARRLDVGFHSYTEEVATAPNQPPRRILHCWLKCTVQLMAEDIRSGHEFFSRDKQAVILRRGGRHFTAVRDPALYMQYDYESGQCALLCTEYAGLFSALQQTCRKAEQTQIMQDPFVFWAVLLKRILNPTRRTAMIWRRQIYRVSDTLAEVSRDKHDLYELLDRFTNDRIAYSRVADAMKGIVQDITDISEEHHEVRGTQAQGSAAFRWVERSLKDQRTVASHLEMLFRDCADMAYSFTEVILGYSQLRNAYATEALAVDAKRDTQTMKTITYVTLVFLPSTFVSTLFSMGIFNFDTDMSPGGHITIARHGWLFLAIALPMTLVTLAVAYLWMRIKGDTLPPKQDDDDARRKELADSSFKVMQQQRGKRPAQRIALSDLPRKNVAELLAVLRRRAASAATTGAARSGVQVRRVVKEPGLPDKSDEIPIEDVPREQVDTLISELEEVLKMKPAENDAQRQPWHRLLSRRRHVQNDAESAAISISDQPAVPQGTHRGRVVVPGPQALSHAHAGQ